MSAMYRQAKLDWYCGATRLVSRFAQEYHLLFRVCLLTFIPQSWDDEGGMAEAKVEPKSEVTGEVVFEWEALERPYKKIDRRAFSTLLVIVISLAVIFLFFKEFWLVVAMFSFLFLFYALTSVEPDKVKHQFTTEGVALASKIFYRWEEINQAWFELKFGEWLLVLTIKKKFPGKVLLLLGDIPYTEIKAKLEERKIAVSETPPLDATDRLSEGISRYLNLG